MWGAASDPNAVVQVKEVGIVIGHGSNAVDWDSKFLTELAAGLATEGAAGCNTLC